MAVFISTKIVISSGWYFTVKILRILYKMQNVLINSCLKG